MTTSPTTARRALLTAVLALAGLLALAQIAHTLQRLGHHGWPLWVRPWCTVLASSAVATGAGAALRGRTWGLLLLLLSSVSFAGAAALGIAPPYFVAMTAVGSSALALAALPLARRDPLAFVAAVGLCVVFGAAMAALAGPGLEALGAITL